MSVLAKNNVKVTGTSAQPMLFAHGFGCDQNMWRFVAPAFESDYRTVLFDHVGAGGSDISAYDRTKYGTLAGYAEDVLEICRELCLERVVFVGHSQKLSCLPLAPCPVAMERFTRWISIACLQGALVLFLPCCQFTEIAHLNSGFPSYPVFKSGLERVFRVRSVHGRSHTVSEAKSLAMEVIWRREGDSLKPAFKEYTAWKSSLRIHVSSRQRIRSTFPKTPLRSRR
ncbi:alpha/beta fold hydrolase [Stigmatella hybrida]|uniref:alpha/beta fold hydrolase n=1 Tax=Stigmatella hybrida TaxID=394097 RepID=UPI001CDAC566|nr:alpha/beta hydrolase [Stigmatella hybrida]